MLPMNMSSKSSSAYTEDNWESGSGQEKKRRRSHRACDMCRLKRVRCEGGQMAYRACTNCVVGRYDCTYTQANTKKSAASDKAYIRSLESRLEKMEQLMTKLAPNEDLIPKSHDDLDRASAVAGSSKQLPERTGACDISSTIPVDGDEVDSSDDEFVAQQTLEELFRKGITLDPGRKQFFGKSSSVMLLQKAMDIREEYSEDGVRQSPPTPSQFHWEADSWVETLSERPKFVFPPANLMSELIRLYFSWYNAYVPLLHRPTLEKAVADQLHLRDDGFASIVLLVCALGARICENPHVPMDDHDSYYSAGWKWFHQAQSAFKLVNFAPPRLFDLQSLCLISQFLHGSSSPYTSWPVIGVGLRLAQSLGAHRRKLYDAGPSVETELLKRAFWVLITQDRGVSSAFGRPSAMQDEDFDVELPLECDDEYWETPDPAEAFKQPPGKPSRVAFFNCVIRLGQIQAFAVRTIYSISKARANTGRASDPEWEERTIAEIDSALNSFVDSIPDHLRWNPHQEDMLTLSQSACLYAQYYSLQITVHRQFIPSPRKPVRSSFPSLAICTNAARSAIHVLDVQYRRVKEAQDPGEFHQVLAPVHALFSAGMVLLLNIWGRKRFGSSSDYTRDLSDVHKALEMLKASERRTYAAGKICEILYQLASSGDLPLPPGLEPSSMQTKPAREDPEPVAPSLATTSATTLDEPNGADHITLDGLQGPLLDAPMRTEMTLPLHGLELGRLPVYLQNNPISADMQVASTVVSLEPSIQEPLSLPSDLSYFPGGSLPQPIASGSSATAGGAYPYQPVQAPSPMLANTTSTMNGGGFGPYPIDSGIERNMLEMWSSAPTGFEWEDWGNYLTNLGSLHDAHGPQTSL